MSSALALVQAIRSRGAKLRVADGKLRVRPRAAVRDLEPEILRRADEIAAALEAKPAATAAPVVTWHNRPATVLEAAGDWVRIAAPDVGLVLTVHKSTLRRAEPRTWLVIGDPAAEMKLAVQTEPPFPDAAIEAAALVGVIDRHHRAGEDALAEAAAKRLEEKLAELRRIGVEVWLAS